MNTSKSIAPRTAFAGALLVALCGLLAACNDIVTSAHAQPAATVVSTEAKYFGDEYAAVHATLRADTTLQAPSF